MPCEDTITLFDLTDLAACASCLGNALGGAALHTGYGVAPSVVPDASTGDAAACSARIARSASSFARSWTDELVRCAARKGSNAETCSPLIATQVEKLRHRLERQIAPCAGRTDLQGCGTAGDAPAIAACIKAEIAPLATAFAEVAWP